MFGKATPISPTEMRKRLLIAESELNRAQLLQEWELMAQGTHAFAHRAKTLAAWASSAALLAAGVAAWRRGLPASDSGKSSWFQKLLRGARAASALWSMLRGWGGDKGPKPTDDAGRG